MGRRRTRAEKREVVARLMASGMTVRGFAAREGVGVATLYRWRREMGVNGGPARVGAAGRRARGSLRSGAAGRKAAPRFVEVVEEGGGGSDVVRVVLPLGIVAEVGARVAGRFVADVVRALSDGGVR